MLTQWEIGLQWASHPPKSISLASIGIYNTSHLHGHLPFHHLTSIHCRTHIVTVIIAVVVLLIAVKWIFVFPASIGIHFASIGITAHIYVVVSHRIVAIISISHHHCSHIATIVLLIIFPASIGISKYLLLLSSSNRRRHISLCQSSWYQYSSRLHRHLFGPRGTLQKLCAHPQILQSFIHFSPYCYLYSAPSEIGSSAE
jgi:hypothetical protein